MNGPDAVIGQANVQTAYLAYTHWHRYGANFELEPLVGMANFNLRFGSLI